MSENAITHGLYSSVLRGKDLARLKTVRQHSNGEILQSNFEMLHAKLMGVVGDGDVQLPVRFEKLYGVAELMAEQEEFDADDLPELKQRLAGVNMETIARISMSAASLASAARSAADEGNLYGQNAIMRNLIVQILRQSGDKVSRTLAVQAIGQLKLEAGLPSEELEALIGEIKEGEVEVDTPRSKDTGILLTGAQP